MSTPSKKRRKAREWMHEQKLKQNSDLKRCLELAKEEADKRVVRAKEEERARLTAMLAPSEDVCHPLGKPEETMFMVPARERNFMPRVLNPRDLRYYDMARVYRFRVKQHAQVMPCGLRVVWYGLEHCG